MSGKAKRTKPTVKELWSRQTRMAASLMSIINNQNLILKALKDAKIKVGADDKATGKMAKRGKGEVKKVEA